MSTTRLDALKQAAWRVKHAGRRCRRCGGALTVHATAPYCERHLAWLPPDLKAAAAEQRDLEECDDLLLLRSQVPNLKRLDRNRYTIGRNGLVARVGDYWAFKHRTTDKLHTVARAPRLAELCPVIREFFAELSTHNHYASKTLIR